MSGRRGRSRDLANLDETFRIRSGRRYQSPLRIAKGQVIVWRASAQVGVRFCRFAIDVQEGRADPLAP